MIRVTVFILSGNVTPKNAQESATFRLNFGRNQGDPSGARVITVFGAPVSAGKSFNKAFQHSDAQRRLVEVEGKAEIVLTHGPLSSSMWTGLGKWGARLND